MNCDLLILTQRLDLNPNHLCTEIYGLSYLGILLLNAIQEMCAPSTSHTKKLMLVFCLFSTLPSCLFWNGNVDMSQLQPCELGHWSIFYWRWIIISSIISVNICWAYKLGYCLAVFK